MMRPPHRQQTAMRRSRPLGMTNLGNTCYLNATLQVRCWHIPSDAPVRGDFGVSLCIYCCIQQLQAPTHR